VKILFLFLDGVGLGADDPVRNPFALADMPHLSSLLEGRRMVIEALPDGKPAPRLETGRATLLPLDATLGVPGLPQSASGQATLLTGANVPAAIGYHYGPKPNPEIASLLVNGNLFSRLQKAGLRASLLNAYPPGYFSAIESGRRLFSAIPLAVTSAGITLKTMDDLLAGEALSADFTGEGWIERLGLLDTPILPPLQAGEHLATLSRAVDFAFFEYWLSDYVGHSQDLIAARSLLETFDQVLGGLLSAWNDQEGLVLITSDHGNLEDLSTRRHTLNPVPALVIGAQAHRQSFAAALRDLTDITPAILQALGGWPDSSSVYN
jgi:2,3-bisphosphoglycerate-independent phosphoglycerate mutase